MQTQARSPEVTSRIMSAIPSRDTRPELALRKAAHALGLRFRVDYRKAPGRPDLAFTSRKLAVFVDGDFWHGNAWRLRGDASLADQLSRWKNPDFWRTKIEQNMERDRRVNRELEQSGWQVLRFWESEILADLPSCVRRVAATCRKLADG